MSATSTVRYCTRASRTARHLAAIVVALAVPATQAEILRVGPGERFNRIADAAKMAKDGDIVEILPGEYRGDVTTWRQKKLLIRGVGERPVLIADGKIAEGKAIWVIRNGDFLIDNIEFRGARAADDNGAGIRFERGRLEVLNSVFIDNQNGILTANFDDAELVIRDSLFAQAPRQEQSLPHLLYVGRIAANNNMNLVQFRSALEKDGIAYADFREEIRGEMIMARLREREVESRLVVSDSEIDNHLANQAASGGGDEYRLAHILLRAPESVTPEQLAKLRKRAEQALAKARAGENFAELTAAYSDAPDALQGGDLGWRPLDRLPTLYAEAAARLGDGKVSDLLRSAAGFHIIKLVAKRGGNGPASVQQTNARHILIRVNEVVSEAEARHRLETVRERIVNGMDFAEQARVFSQDGSAAKGGDLG